jgi:predicted O-methyltransferase YrrM
MEQDQWSLVDAYVVDKLVSPDSALQAALIENTHAGLPAHDVSPAQGKFLHLLARVLGAKRVLEIGTLGAYSTIWLARALPPEGRIVTLELDPHHAEVAERNLAKAGLATRVDLRVGPALETLPRLLAEGAGPFDLVFIDADKPNNSAYLDWAMKLSRPRTVIIGDNVVRNGAVINADSTDDRVRGVRAFFDQMAADPRLDATALQTVGSKGWDGFVFAVVR